MEKIIFKCLNIMENTHPPTPKTMLMRWECLRWYGPFHLISTPPCWRGYWFSTPSETVFGKTPSEICYFSRNPLGNFRFFSSPSEILVDEVPSRKTPSEILKFFFPLRKFCIIFIPPQKQTLLTRLLVFYPLGNLRFPQGPSEILVDARDPFGNFQIFKFL
jgi:hypothetical protein